MPPERSSATGTPAGRLLLGQGVRQVRAPRSRVTSPDTPTLASVPIVIPCRKVAYLSPRFAAGVFGVLVTSPEGYVT